MNARLPLWGRNPERRLVGGLVTSPPDCSKAPALERSSPKGTDS